MLRLSKIFEPINFLLAPQFCAVCESLINTNNKQFSFLCKNCYDAMPVTADSRELLSRLSNLSDSALLSVSSLINLKENRKFMNMIYNLKYHGMRKVGYEIGKELGKFLIKVGDSDYDFVIPVPIHKAKKRERGYNQSDYIAKGVSEVTSIPLQIKLTKRTKYTQTQTRLLKSERSSNVRGIFEIANKKINIKNKSVLIVDDVFTTGSTINSLAQVILELGAKKVSAATLACA
jgi:ComF family protein